MSWKGLAKTGLLTAVSKLTGRHAVLLPREAKDEESLLRISAPYRVEGDSLRMALRETESGDLHVTLLGYEGHFPKKTLWKSSSRYDRPEDLSLDLRTGEIRLGERTLGKVQVPLPTRRFCFRLELETTARTKSRLTGHYLASNGNGSYFEGDNYVDYEAEAAGDVPKVLSLFDKHGARGPVLEIGCASGLFGEGLLSRGFSYYGIDYAPWAVEKARERIGADRIYLGNVEEEGTPDVLAARGPFGTLLLWAVLEHFHKPFRVLESLTEHVSRGSTLLINSTNARSLNRLLFGTDWEGYFDTSHHGVDAVSVDSLQRALPTLGWKIVELRTHLSWDTSADPTHAALREWWAADARFRRLLAELDRGDLVTVVAVKE